MADEINISSVGDAFRGSRLGRKKDSIYTWSDSRGRMEQLGAAAS